MAKEKDKLPQSMKQLLMEIGEKLVLFHLWVRLSDREWEVYNSLNDKGCDLVLINQNNKEKVRIEVKTRQKLYTTGNSPRTANFSLSKNEYDQCDFVVGYWLDDNDFFIFPKERFNISSSGEEGKSRYQFRVSKNQQGELDERSSEFHNRWDLIINKIDSLS